MLIPLGILAALASGQATTAIAGYVSGGQDSGGNFLASVEKFLFSNDSRSILGTGLSGGRDYISAMSSPLAGYFVAGGTNGPRDTVDKFLFSNDSRTTLGTGTSIPRFGSMGFDSLVAGYIAGGTHYTSGFPQTTNVDKFLFTNDSRTTLGTGLSSARGPGGAFSSSVAGYADGGTTMDKFDFSNDNRSTLGTGMSGTNAGSGFASTVAGYSSGGSSTSNVDKFLFSNDSRSSLGTGLSSARVLPGGWGSPTAGYVSGSFTTWLTSIDKFLFTNDSRSSLGTGLNTGRGSHAGFPGNSVR
jgi:hypothetical protein